MSAIREPRRGGRTRRRPSFHQSWFPVALASERASRAAAGPGLPRAPASSSTGTRPARPWCRAPIARIWAPTSRWARWSTGQIRCAYHHWRFDCAGRCVDIPAGDKIPPGARIATYPSAEAWGLIWAFNGTAPTVRRAADPRRRGAAS